MNTQVRGPAVGVQGRQPQATSVADGWVPAARNHGDQVIWAAAIVPT